MKKVLFLFSALLIFNITACDDSGDSNCNFEEFRENVAESECLAEDLIRSFGCPNMGCFSNDPDISLGDPRACTFIDCETLSCEDMRVDFNDPQPGLVTEIMVSEGGVPIGIFLVDDLEGDFSCFVAIP